MSRCLCGFKGTNCDQGRACPLNALPEKKPGLSRDLLWFLAAYVATLLGGILLMRACA